jgi:hypothetical protein
MTENEHFGLVFVKTGSINSGTEEGAVVDGCGLLSFYSMVFKPNKLNQPKLTKFGNFLQFCESYVGE